MKNKKFDEVKELLLELTRLNTEYYENRTILGFSLPDEITYEERENLELRMPLLKKRIENIRQELEDITIV